jgi:RHH-type proline utilization regulon transcriptional repressor/proline dehydrogenase/delta 1-pyrroline-5-carboxylate dehydrogenase
VLCLGGGEDEQAFVTQVFRSLNLGNLVQVTGTSNVSAVHAILDAFKKVEVDGLLTVIEKQAEQALAESDMNLVLFDGDEVTRTAWRKILAARTGARIALENAAAGDEMLTIERVISTDTTAAGGNASLLALGES